MSSTSRQCNASRWVLYVVRCVVGSVNYMVMLDEQQQYMTVLNLQDNQFLGQTHVYKGNESKVDSMEISVDEKCIYISSVRDEDIHTFDLRSLKRLNTLRGEKCTVCAVYKVHIIYCIHFTMCTVYSY
jgi:hypothetical protein